jgi:adhesin transport system outer membrane protein
MNLVKRLFFLSVLLLSFSSASVFAQSLRQLIPELLNQHERIKAAEDRRDAAMHQVREALGGWYPKVDLNMDAGPEWVRLESNRSTSEFKNQEELRATQLLTDFGLTQSGVERARAALERAVAELEATRQDVMLEGIAAYLNIVRARERLGYAKKSEGNLRRLTEMEESLVKRGAGLSTDVLQTRSQLAGTIARRVSEEGALALAKIRFKTVYKWTPSEDQVMAFSMPEKTSYEMPDSLETAVSVALQSNPQVLAAEHDIEISQQELENRKARYFPRLNLFGEGNRRMNHLGIPGDRLEGYVGVEFVYNIYNGGSDAAAIRAALSNVSESRNVLIDTKWLVEEDARSAWQTYLTARDTQVYLWEQADTLGRFLELAKKERKLGTRSLLDVLTGEVSYINAVSLAVSAEIDTVISAYNLLRAMGRLTMEVF